MLGFNAPSKKWIKDQIAAGNPPSIYDFIETSLFGHEFKGDGNYAVVGPDPYKNRKWYATLTVRGEFVVNCK